ncbi:phosphatidylinositol 3-kinase 2-like [Anopheles arabiensis]|uniref:phosphatidylinositol 3-kinase 2-like n=1 Tax=Anopheles arabiensis TaxID=7173 RepID=UPI001AAD9EAE|nr:phosphatidylinositol 3-kinase 2-like [Anopheles arabiensis]XP_040173694.1 phosphatidylinositol 3-kinase 2-like [Anopheles arabiensis]XP_040173695.1 phosphatidylinositol 3-kinase 2-like [Anopheles arabiensis]XP_040173696.1 phosphatidylinositol 3-kinase 2-like [Anopheles arabiensis]
MLCARLKIVLCLIQLLAMQVSHSVLGLESVHIQVPVAVLVGTSATLICECDLPDDELYSVKWYKGKHEFFRYTSKEIPSIKIFPKAGISVNVNLSNASHLVLVNVEPQSSGKYSCEITEAAPSFHTKIATRTMNVVDLPATAPQILDIKPFYGAEEFLEVECRSGPSLPAPKLEWFVNDLPLHQPLPVPSRLEYGTQPGSAGRPTTVSSAGSSSSSSSRKKQSAKSSLPAPTVPPSTDGESRENDLAEVLPGRPRPAIGTTNGSSSSSTTTTITTTTTTSSSSSSSQEPAGNGTSGEHRKVAGNSRYELAVSRLKLLLEHGHFRNGKLKVECAAHIFDLYQQSTVATADENYPQVRVLSNSDNGVHFSFMSDKDEASSSGSPRSVLAYLPGQLARLAGTIGGWAAHPRTVHGGGKAIVDTGQPALVSYVLLGVGWLSLRWWLF